MGQSHSCGRSRRLPPGAITTPTRAVPVNPWGATRSRMHTYQGITDHKSPTDHYRHISQLLTSMRRPAPGRCDMSPRPRIASVSVASAAAIGLSVAIGVAPPATAEPCTGAAAAATPPAAPNAGATPSLPGLNRLPLGHKPPNANEHAPLPSLGRLPLAILNALTPHSGRLQQQAAVIPSPNPGTGNQPPPNATQPDAATAQPPPAPDAVAAPGTSLVGWVTGPESPNDTIRRFAITGTDLGIMWDNGDPINHQVLMAFGDTIGYCSVRGRQWRYNTLFRSQDRALSHTTNVPNGVACKRDS